MQIEIVQNGQVLRRITHNDQAYVEAPPEGEYVIRLTNNSPSRRLAVVSVDGLNVIDGKDAGYEGSGYVLGSWQTVDIKGFLRSHGEAAAFTFSASEGSYAAQTGRGTKNTGVIGVAVFDEMPKPIVLQSPPVVIEHHHHHHPYQTPWVPMRHPFWWSSTTDNTGVIGTRFDSVKASSSVAEEDSFACDSLNEECISEPPTANAAHGEYTTASMGLTQDLGRTRSPLRSRAAAPDLGTAYGRRVAFHTQDTQFQRATTAPAYIVTLRYGVRDKLREWGVPVDEPVMAAPNPFPAAGGFAQPPAGWRG